MKFENWSTEKKLALGLIVMVTTMFIVQGGLTIGGFLLTLYITYLMGGNRLD